MPEPIEVGIVAGEASGDALGAHLIRALVERHPEMRFVGVGGPKMIGAGLDSWFPQEKLAVRGIVEVVRHLREITTIHREVVRRMRRNPPALFIGVDAPDTNLRIARKLRRSGINTAQYVSPTLWAWRPGRIKTIKAAISHMLVLFPFEEKVYREAGVPVTFVGHPLADEIPDEIDRELAREQLRIRGNHNVIAILPGSRQSEIELIAPTFLRAAKLIHAARPEVQFLAPFISRETLNMFEQALYDTDTRELPIQRMFGHSHEAMAAADVVLVASGTATLEAALLRRPMIIAYKLNPLTWRIARPMVKLKQVGLPNILAGEVIAPEFLQDDATPENIAQATLNLLDDKTVRSAVVSRCADLHLSLRRNAAQCAADALLPLLRAHAGT